MALYYTLKLTPSLANRNVIKILVLNAGDMIIIGTGGTRMQVANQGHIKSTHMEVVWLSHFKCNLIIPVPFFNWPTVCIIKF